MPYCTTFIIPFLLCFQKTQDIFKAQDSSFYLSFADGVWKKNAIAIIVYDQ